MEDNAYYERFRNNYSEHVAWQHGEGWASMLMPHRKNQDALFVADMGEIVVGGVLDGVGTGTLPDSGLLARAVAEHIEASIKDNTIDAEQLAADPAHYISFFEDLEAYANNYAGAATLILAAVDRTRGQAGYLSIGDSRIYHINHQEYQNDTDPKSAHEDDEHTTLLTTDEEIVGFVNNAISATFYHGVNQIGTIPMHTGDRMLMVSDGVYRSKIETGGTFADARIGDFVRPDLNCLNAITNIVIMEAHWPDDKSAVLIEA